MSFDPVLNELSLRLLAPDIPSARERMSQLLLSIRAASVLGANSVLRSSEDPNVALLAADYPVAKWRNDPDVDVELRRFYRSLVTKIPLDLDLPEFLKLFDVRAFEYDGIACQGLGAANLLDTIAFSLPSEECWNTRVIKLRVMFHDPVRNDLQLRDQDQLHASSPAHIESHRRWIRTRLARSVTDGADMAERCQQLVPGIDFCESALQQLIELDRNHAMLRPVVKKLFELNSYAQSWVDGPFNSRQLPMMISGESEATLAQFSAERTFRCPDGEYRLFELHARLTPLAWRLHFFPQAATRRIIVGYIGAHLRTARYRN